jgi:hypothetical protein
VSERIEGSDGRQCIVPPDERRCAATATRTGERCLRWAIAGGTVCPTHGGSIARVKASAARRVAEGEVLAVYERYSPNGDGPVDMYAALERLVARMTGFAEFASARIEALTAEQWRTFSTRTAAEVGMFQQACRDAGRLLTDVAKLGLIERAAAAQARITEEQGARLHGAISGALAELGLNAHDPAVRRVVAAHLERIVADLDGD